MRDRVLQPDLELLAPAHLPVMRERSDASVVRAAMDLQQRAGNRSVTELVERSHASSDQHVLAALSSAGRTSGSATAGGGVSVQREPCTNCPEAALQAKAAGPADLDAGPDPGQTG